MKICFTGLGSIAARHIRNLQSLFPEGVQIDVVRSGKGKPIGEEIVPLIHQVYEDYEKLPDDYDVVFITNPTRLHYETLQRMLPKGKHFFIEKPVFETGYEELEGLKQKKGSIFYVACPLRYTNVIQYLKKHVDFSSVYSVRSISSSYLPEWRLDSDYRTSYSAKRELGGGVSLDLIHEWDYVCYLIGIPKRVKSIITRKSELEIDSDDLAVYLGEYEDKVAELHLDYFGRAPIRKLELFGREDTIEADLLKQCITYRKRGEVVSLWEDRDSYQRKELKHFFRMVHGEAVNDNPVERACQMIRIARGEDGSRPDSQKEKEEKRVL